MEIIEKLSNVYRALQDKESEKIFNLRLQYIIDHDEEKFSRSILKMYNEWKCKELDNILNNLQTEGIILFGCGKDGKQQKENLEQWGYRVDFFCDNDVDKVGTFFNGIKILSVMDVAKNYNNYLVIISSRKYGNTMYKELMEEGIPEKNILLPEFGLLIATHGKQYFDVWKSSGLETFIDCGAYNGDNIFDFIEWTNGKYKDIFVLEPINRMCNVIAERIEEEGVDFVRIYNKAAWNKEDTIYFDDFGPGSSETEHGKNAVDGVKIDSLLDYSSNPLFIKMDIEGSELNALMGAQETIRNRKPRLAICIYHKNDDIYEIGSYLLELVPEYKFLLRHYNSNQWETVLYAYVD